MDTVTRNITRNEAGLGESPQLDGADAFAAVDVTLELAELSIGQLSAVAALMLSLDAAEARARSAERQLADHHRHCICRAAEIAAAEAGAAAGFVAEECEAAAFRAAA